MFWRTYLPKKAAVDEKVGRELVANTQDPIEDKWLCGKGMMERRDEGTATLNSSFLNPIRGRLGQAL